MIIPAYLRRQFGLMACIMAVTTADGAITVLLPPLLQRQGKDPATIGLLIATLAVTALLIRLPGGMLYSEGRARPIMVGALVLSAGTVALFPLTSNGLLLALIGAAYGAGYSLSTTVNMAVFMGSLQDDGRRHQAVSLYAGGMAFGYALGSFGGGAAASWLGFRQAFLFSSAASALGLVFVLTNRVIADLRQRSPAPSGLLPGATVRSLAAAARDPLVLFIVSGAFFINIFLAQFNTFMPLTLLPLGLSLAEIGALRGLWSLTNAVSRASGSRVLSHLGPRRAQTGGLMVQAAMLMLFALPLLPFAAYAVLTIAAASGRAIAYIANTLALSEVDPRRLSRGLASSVMNAAGDLGKIVGPVAGGLLARQVGLTSFWLIAPPLFLILYGITLGLRRGEQAAAGPIGETEAATAR